MKGSSRFLPGLNLCYLQKKAYQTHLQKIKNARGSLQRIQRTHSYSNQQPGEQLQNVLSEKMATIKEKTGRAQLKMSPFNKKIQQQTKRQNYRLFKAIQKCSPTLDRKNISKHSLLSQQFRERLCKFKTVPEINKTLLKCEISLQKLGKSRLGLSKGSHQISSSKMNKETKASRVKTTNCQFITSYEESQQQGGIKKDYTENNILLSRNKNKIKSHFERSQMSMRLKQKLQGFRQNLQSKQSKKIIHKWKARCFTTQTQSHEPDQLQN